MGRVVLESTFVRHRAPVKQESRRGQSRLRLSHVRLRVVELIALTFLSTSEQPVPGRPVCDPQMLLEDSA